MILIRPAFSRDEHQLKKMAATSGFDFALPPLSRILLSALVEVDGEIEMAALLRPTFETYLLLDEKQHSRRDRLGKLLALHKELIKPVREADCTDVHAWLPPEIERRFGKLLVHVGWRRSEWPCYFAEV